MKVPQQTKTSSKPLKKEYFRNVIRVSLYVFPAVIVFCKINMFLLSNLPNLIIDSVSCWVSSRWVGFRLAGGFGGPWIQ